jgi:hypothetical protein
MIPIQVPIEGGQRVNILGIPMLIRLHGRDTGGVLSVVESHDVPGGGPPLHLSLHAQSRGRLQVSES